MSLQVLDHNLAALARHFNEHTDRARVLALVSPT